VNQRYTFPIFLQPRFISEWLISKPAAYEKRFREEQRIYSSPKVWTQEQLPTLITSINSKEILQSRNLAISFALSESTYVTTDNYAYAVVDLNHFMPFPGSELQKEFLATRA